MATYKQVLKEYNAVQFDGKNHDEVKALVGDTSEGDTILVGTGHFEPADPKDPASVPTEKTKPLVVKKGDWVTKAVPSGAVEVNPEGFPEDYSYVP